MKLYNCLLSLQLFITLISISISASQYLRPVTLNKQIQKIIMGYIGTGWKFKKNINLDTGGIRAHLFSQDGQQLLLCLKTGEIKIYDFAVGSFVHHMYTSHVEPVVALFFTTAKELTTIDRDGTLNIWDVGDSFSLNYKQQYALSDRATFLPPYAYNTTGQVLASCTKKHAVQIYDFDSPNPPEFVSTIIQHTDKIKQLAFTQSGDLLATGSCDKTVRVYDLLKNKMIHIASTKGPVTALAWVCQDQVLIFCSELDTAMQVWDRNSSQTATIENGAVGLTIESTPVNNEVYVGNSDGTISVYHASRGELDHIITNHVEPVNFIVCSLDGKYMLSGNTKQHNGYKLSEKNENI